MSEARRKIKGTKRNRESNLQSVSDMSPPAPNTNPDSPHPVNVVKSSRWTIWVALTLIALNLVVYAQVGRYDFVDYDDRQYVKENPHVSTGLSWQNVSWALTAKYEANWHPLTWLSHMMDVQLYGMHAGPHHVTNLAIHILSTLLLFGLLFRTTAALGPSAFVASLFAVHPLHVESVAWIAERKDVLSTLFWMLTLWAYVSYVRERCLRRYLTVLVLFALGLMAKPMLVTLPFVLLLLDLWPLRRIPFGVEPSWPIVRQLVFEKLPLLAIAAASSVVTVVAQQQGGAMVRLDLVPFSVRAANAALSYLAYIGSMIWPARLAAFYPLSRSLPPLWVGGAVLVLISLTVAAVSVARRYPYLIVGWLWYLGTLVPVIGLIQVGAQSRADRYTYIPLIGLFIMAAFGVSDLARRSTAAKRALPILGGIAILACTIAAHAQTQHWETSSTLWTHALAVTSENYMAHNGLGYVFLTQRKFDEAIAHYDEALRIRPDFASAHNDLGIALARQGKFNEAISHFSEALRIKPGYTEAQNNLNATIAKRQEDGAASEAIARYVEAVHASPNDVVAHNNLGNALAEQGRVEEAIREFNEALRLLPNSPDLHYNLAVMLDRGGHAEEALQHLRAALKLNPNHQDARRTVEDLAKREKARTGQ